MWLASQPAPVRERIIRELKPETKAGLRWSWGFWARPDQLPPTSPWRTWLVLAGRGWGKTRVGVEWVRAQVESKRAGRIALVGATAADVRDVIVEGESGILAVSPPDFRPIYEPSKRRLTWPNGAQATTYSADEPDRLRGPQHDAALADELAAWRYPQAWDMLRFGLRLGADPRVVVTTTPRPTPIIRGLIKEPTTVVTRGSTYDNAPNLAPGFLTEIVSKYEGTRLGRQELHAEILDDVAGALWHREQLDALRVQSRPPVFERAVVAIDPAVSNNEGSDETGIVVAALARCGCKGNGADLHAFVLDDLSGKWSPDAWARKAIGAYRTLPADRIVAEVNNGGALVEVNLRTVDPHASYRAVHAAQGKRTRAEPIAALYEQGKVHHVGMLAQLEDQMCTWDPLAGDRSPDRMDACVWALTELMLGSVVADFSSEPDEILSPLRM